MPAVRRSAGRALAGDGGLSFLTYMLLVVQVAAGILLAALVWRFWRQGLLIAGVLAVLGLLLLVVLWFNRDVHWGAIPQFIWGVIIAAAVLPAVIGRIQRRSERAVIVDDSQESAPESHSESA